MEEVRETAQVYYKVVSENVMSLAKEFFKKMDDNRDGKVSLVEFAGFMVEAGYAAMNNPSFFEEINKNKNRELDSTMSRHCTTYYKVEGHYAVVAKSLLWGCISLVSNVLDVRPEAFVFTVPVLAVDSMFTSLLISWTCFA
ncbi:hypothetical protein LOK49_LG08G02584 [Camellia lanceoleosa]|uniref:Uncharacterized protein n=1 Tax=Camellia lanceoleosa TaxID=1840588 RepID=A0ACC0GQE9_9ERIC|nr:hypothetical protein LOK49_LG08G02584 [Camellia lanceoleosa]